MPYKNKIDKANWQRKFEKNNPELVQKYHRDWYRANRTSVLERKSTRYYALSQTSRRVYNFKKKIKSNYNLDWDQFKFLWRKQSGRCLICCRKLKLFDRATHIDHSKISGLVRGILCSHCNLMLGQARESKVVLERAVKYLEGSL